jgi:dTDP-4-dehydrorhamnose 3,5-epimerase
VDKQDLRKITITPLRQIAVTGGDVLHALKNSDEGFMGFGEAYFSIIELNSIKAWKLHRLMTLNLVVPLGMVKFVFFDANGLQYRDEIVGDSSYKRITVPPGIWFGFKGLANPMSIILNIADIEHSEDEVERKQLSEFEYNWG